MGKKIVIVGGVAGGASVAARSRRLDESNEIVMFERGPHVSFSNCCLPYHLSGKVEDHEDLVLMKPEQFFNQYRIDARVFTEVVFIDRENKEVTVRNVVTGKEYKESYDKLILSPGAKPIVPPIAGINNADIFTVRNVVDIAKLNTFIKEKKCKNVSVIGGGFIGVEVAENLKEAGYNIFTVRNVVDIAKLNTFIKEKKCKNVSVIGGGFIGVEVAENLKEAGYSVSLIEAMDQIMKPFDVDMVQVLHKEIYDKGINLILGDNVEAFEGNNVVLASEKRIESDAIVMAIGVVPETDLAREMKPFYDDIVQVLHKEIYDKGINLILGDKVEAFEGNNVVLASEKRIESDAIVMAIGVVPETDLAREAGLEVGVTGAIKVNQNYMTNDKDIYAVGDAIEVFSALTRTATKLPLAGPAQKQARAVANHIHGIPVRNTGFIGSSCIKVFDYNGASTGLTEGQIKAQKLDINYDI